MLSWKKGLCFAALFQLSHPLHFFKSRLMSKLEVDLEFFCTLGSQQVQEVLEQSPEFWNSSTVNSTGLCACGQVLWQSALASKCVRLAAFLSSLDRKKGMAMLAVRCRPCNLVQLTPMNKLAPPSLKRHWINFYKSQLNMVERGGDVPSSWALQAYITEGQKKELATWISLLQTKRAQTPYGALNSSFHHKMYMVSECKIGRAQCESSQSSS